MRYVISYTTSHTISYVFPIITGGLQIGRSLSFPSTYALQLHSRFPPLFGVLSTLICLAGRALQTRATTPPSHALTNNLYRFMDTLVH